MKNMLKKMTPEEAEKFRRSGANLMALPFALIVVMGSLLAFSPQFRNLVGLEELAGNSQMGTYDIPREAIIGTPYEYDFADELIPLLGSEDNPPIYSFYLGTMNGFPPMGLTLWPDGVLKGTPTGKSGDFEVCVKDSGGKSACRKYHLDVRSEADTVPATDTESDPASASIPGRDAASLPACSTALECGEATDSGMAFGGGPVFDYCPCPSDRYDGGPVIGSPNQVWAEGSNGPGTSAGKTDSSGVVYWLLSDGEYHSQKNCWCK
jgi:hypothetical protein